MKRTITAAATWALLLGLSLCAKADDTNPPPRVFAITPSNTARPAVCPDLLAPGSIAVLTAPTVHSGTYVFADCPANIITNADGCEIDLRNTVWDVRPVMHVTNNGVVNYSSWWRRPIDDPTVETPPGVVCRTGPEGDVLARWDVLISQTRCDSDLDDDEWSVVTTGGTRRFCIAIGLCNK